VVSSVMYSPGDQFSDLLGLEHRVIY
jgi:hypothetical protein